MIHFMSIHTWYVFMASEEKYRRDCNKVMQKLFFEIKWMNSRSREEKILQKFELVTGELCKRERFWGGYKIWVGEIKLALKQFKRKVNLLLICVDCWTFRFSWALQKFPHKKRDREMGKKLNNEQGVFDACMWGSKIVMILWFNILWEYLEKKLSLYSISKKRERENTIERQTFN